ncbi:MAG: ribonuclease E/G, partial [Firmicutes bacterium]|nr:ribonuclease E/G [Bacillota bacterium]
DRTEAMTVIDVNSGKYTGRRSLGDTVRRLNAEAAREIARLIRLRDIGGIIVVDFVDMETEEDRRAVLAALREVLARDRAKHHVYGFTGAGLLEMTRRPVFMPVEETLFTPCGRCLGKGMLPSADAGALALRREVRRRRAAGDESEISLDAPEDVIRALRAGGVPERVRLRSAGGAV